MIKSRNVIPALKDRVVNFATGLGGAVLTGEKAVLFLNPFYDYQIVGMGALVDVAVAAAAAPFTLGYGAYTDKSGVLHPAVNNQFLPAASCVDGTGAPFGTNALPAGTIVYFKIQPDTLGQGLNILRAGSPLIIASAAATNAGTLTVFVALRPKDKDHNDFSKRPGGASDEGYGAYYK